MESVSAGAAARIDHNFGNGGLGDLNFVSISAYRDSSVYDDWEQAGFPLKIVGIHINKQGYKTFSQEFQLLSTAGRLQWIAGLYYSHDESGFVGPDGIQISGIAVSPSEMITALITTKSYAAFGDATCALPTKIRLYLPGCASPKTSAVFPSSCTWAAAWLRTSRRSTSGRSPRIERCWIITSQIPRWATSAIIRL